MCICCDVCMEICVHPSIVPTYLLLLRTHAHSHPPPHPPPSWRPEMHTPFFQKHHWRKSSQWWGLIRPHADLLSQETTIWSRFQAHCGACIADEHYPASALSAYGLTEETDCWGKLHWVNWDPGVCKRGCERGEWGGGLYMWACGMYMWACGMYMWACGMLCTCGMYMCTCGH